MAVVPREQAAAYAGLVAHSRARITAAADPGKLMKAMIRKIWLPLAVVAFAACGGDVSVTETVIEPVVIFDQGGKQWNITQAVYRYGFEKDKFEFGFGADAIRPIILPKMVSAGDSLFPSPDSVFAVLGTTLAGEARAYGERSVAGFEVVNDVSGARALAVVLQPATGSAAAYVRTTDGRTLTLSASGWLYEDQTVLYDRDTESLWYGLDGEPGLTCINGEFLDNILAAVPVTRTSWGSWLAMHPQTRVMHLSP